MPQGDIERNDRVRNMVGRNVVFKADMLVASTDVPPDMQPVIVWRIEAEDWPAARAAALS